MPNQYVLFRSEASEKILRGATTLADAVRVTLGPKSKCVLVDKKYGRPLVCTLGGNHRRAEWRPRRAGRPERRALGWFDASLQHLTAAAPRRRGGG